MASQQTKRPDLSPALSAYSVPVITLEEIPSNKPTNEQIKAAVLKWLRDNLSRSRAIMSLWHLKWDRYRRFYAGEWSGDTTTESFSLNEMYRPLLAEFIDFANANELMAMIPDAQTMDFVNVDSDWPGLEEDALKGQALLRKKLKIMRTESASSLYEAILQLKQDHRVCGNMIGVITHDIFSGDLDGDNEDVSEGPTIMRVPPRNWFPGSVTVDSAHRTFHFIYSPLMEDEADRIPSIDAKALREAVAPKYIRRTESIYYENGISETPMLTDGPADYGWRRFVYLGPLPWYRIAEDLGMNENWERQDVVDALAEVFGFDPALGNKQWWFGDFIDDGNLLNTFEPYSLDLPEGLGPVLHAKYHAENDQLIGRGIYDRNSAYERQYNELNRLICQLGRWAGEPPMIVNPGLIDEDWLSEHMDMANGERGESFLEPGEMILLKSGIPITNQTDPFKLLTLNTAQVIEQMRMEMNRLEEIMRGDTMVTADYTGNSNANTATQAMNNASQSKTLENHQVRLGENGWFKEIIERCYIVLRQVIGMRGEDVTVAVSSDEKDLSVFTIPPSAIRSLSYFTVSVSGSMAPSSRVYQIQQLQQAFGVAASAMSNPQIALQLGDLDFRELYKAIIESMQIRNKQRFFKRRDDVNASIANLSSLLGQRGIASLSPAAQQQVMGMVMDTMKQNPALFPPGQSPMSPGAPAAKPSGMGSAPNGMAVGRGMSNSISGMAPMNGPMPDINQGQNSMAG